MEKTTNSTTSTDQSSTDELTLQDLDEGFVHCRHYVTKLYVMTQEIWNSAADGQHKICNVSINKIYETVAALHPMWAGPEDKAEYKLLAKIFPPRPVSDINGRIHKLKRQIIQTINAGLIAPTVEEKKARFKEVRGNTLVFIYTCLCISSYAHGIFRVKQKVRKVIQSQPD